MKQPLCASSFSGHWARWDHSVFHLTKVRDWRPMKTRSTTFHVVSQQKKVRLKGMVAMNDTGTEILEHSQEECTAVEIRLSYSNVGAFSCLPVCAGISLRRCWHSMARKNRCDVCFLLWQCSEPFPMWVRMSAAYWGTSLAPKQQHRRLRSGEVRVAIWTMLVGSTHSSLAHYPLHFWKEEEKKMLQAPTLPKGRNMSVVPTHVISA